MPALGFSGSIMGVVAYGEVKGSDGTSAFQNNGSYNSARTGAGVYTLTPFNADTDIQTDNLSQVLIQVKTNNGVLRGSTVDTDSATGVITVRILNGANQAADADFSYTILRSTLTPPVGSPA